MFLLLLLRWLLLLLLELWRSKVMLLLLELLQCFRAELEAMPMKGYFLRHQVGPVPAVPVELVRLYPLQSCANALLRVVQAVASGLDLVHHMLLPRNSPLEIAKLAITRLV